MSMKAVCVLKGTGEVTGTVHFEQQVEFYHMYFYVAILYLAH